MYWWSSHITLVFFYVGSGDSVPDSTDWGSVQDFDGREIGESPKDATSKFILRFVERVCTEAGVTPQHLKALQTNIPSEFIMFTKWVYSLLICRQMHNGFVSAFLSEFLKYLSLVPETMYYVTRCNVSTMPLFVF